MQLSTCERCHSVCSTMEEPDRFIFHIQKSILTVHISLAENHPILFGFYFSQIIKKTTSKHHN
jgi:hypothetical protein